MKVYFLLKLLLGRERICRLTQKNNTEMRPHRAGVIVVAMPRRHEQMQEKRGNDPNDT